MIFRTENECRNAICGMETRKGLVNDIALRQIRHTGCPMSRFDLLDEQEPRGADLASKPRRKTVGRHVPGLRNVGGAQSHRRWQPHRNLAVGEATMDRIERIRERQRLMPALNRATIL